MRWLFGGESHRRMIRVATGLTLVMGGRIAFGPYRHFAGQPPELFRPRSFLHLLDKMPPAEVIAAAQVVGVIGALLVVGGRLPRTGFAMTWCSLLLLAGLRTSLGKLLHNDTLLLLVAVPFLLAPLHERPEDDITPSRRYGFPIRAALVVIAGSYFFAGVQKLRFSGLAWVTGDNMRHILYDAAAGTKAPTSAVSLFIADRPWLSHVGAAAILGLELAFPLILLSRRLRPVFAASAVLMHAATWLTLGLDYWASAACCVVVLCSEVGMRQPREEALHEEQLTRVADE
ncbi:MAG TPA: hypothetical protein VM030_10695 [Acidimicrobiales bacterium]|nr:hypothetical protein [Acidimicrobiales bacterium]